MAGTASALALSQFPKEYQKLRDNAELIANMMAEIIRWQTPIAHMRRTALEVVEFHGKTIRKGGKVVMWNVSGNRDESVFCGRQQPNYRSAQRTLSPVLWLWPASLHGQSVSRTAAATVVERNSAALSPSESGRQTRMGAVKLRSRLFKTASRFTRDTTRESFRCKTS